MYTECLHRLTLCLNAMQQCSERLQLVARTFHTRHLPTTYLYSRVSPMLPTWHPDDGCRLLPLIVWTFRPFTFLQSASGRFGFRFHRLERPASPRRICAVTRGFQTTTQDLSVFLFLPRHYHMTRVLLSPFITTVWTHVVLTIINII